MQATLLPLFLLLTLAAASLPPPRDNYQASTYTHDIPQIYHVEHIDSDVVDDDDDDDDDDSDGARGFLTPTRTVRSDFKLPVLRGGAILSEKQLRMMLCSALVTLAFEASMGHGLEFVKIYKMTNMAMSYGEIVKKITAEKGIIGIWDGFVPWGVLQSIGKGGAFGMAHALILPVLMTMAAEGKMPEQFAKVLAGGLAGGFQGYVLSPLLLLKTRVMTDPVFRTKMPTSTTILRSFQVGANVLVNDGVLGLMKGSNTFAFKRVFDWSTRYYFAEVVEQVFESVIGHPLDAKQKMAASLIGGSISAVSTLPLDSLLSKIQDAKNSGNADSAMTIIKKEYKQGGVKQLWNNYMVAWEMRCVHVGLTTVALKTWSPMVYAKLFN